MAEVLLGCPGSGGDRSCNGTQLSRPCSVYSQGSWVGGQELPLGSQLGLSWVPVSEQ